MSTRPLALPAALVLLAGALQADTFTVTNTNPGVINGSFLKAISEAQLNPGPDVIAFNLPGAPPFKIQPSSNPTITTQIVFDGRTQPGYAGTPLVELDGTSVGNSNLRIVADGCEIHGLAIYDYVDGVFLAGASNTTIRSCWIGITADGQHAYGNGITQHAGAGITISGGSDNVIGGVFASEGNLISGNTCGVRVAGGAARTEIQSNLIGTDPTGTSPFGAQFNGVTVHDATDTLVRRNTIAYHDAAGVWVRDPIGGGCCDGVRCDIRQNAIFCNGGLGIQLGHPPFPGNDPLDQDTGPNELQNMPVLHSAVAYAGFVYVRGSLDSTPSTAFTLELFANTACTGTQGEAEQYLHTYHPSTDAAGHDDFAMSIFKGLPAVGTEIRAIVRDLAGNTSPISVIGAVVVAGGPIAYVDPDAPGNGSGVDWENAFPDLQDALDAARPSSGITEIRVARGFYRPSRRQDPGDPRTATFEIPDGVAVRGSFAGWGAPDPDVQDFDDPAVRPVLTGDLASNDGILFCPGIGHSGFGENAYHVVDMSGTGSTTLLEGFHVVQGNADGASPYNSGGGIFMFPSDATVRKCTIRSNQAAFQGGGVYSAQGGLPQFEDCDIWVNLATTSGGGGMWQSASGLMEMRRCSFRGNLALGSANGGGLGISTTQVRLIDCEFNENEAGGSGGGIYSGFSFDGLVESLGSTFNGNTAGGAGGGIWCWVDVTARNSIFWNNTASSGTLAEQQMTASTGSLSVAFCDVEGWTAGGAGNISQDPRFRDDASECIGVSVDLELYSDSPCIDAGNNGYVDPWSFVDLALKPRRLDDPLTDDTGVGSAPIVDMGAFEYDRQELGAPYCFGDGSGIGCPCGNDVPTVGESCMHSGGTGMVITATGSTSIAADNLTIVVSQVPPGNGGLIYSGTQALDPPNVIWDGLQCALGDTRRFQPKFQGDGTFTDTDFVAQDPTGVYFVPGVVYNFQLWTRDAALPSPCGTGANYSPAYAVRMTP